MTLSSKNFNVIALGLAMIIAAFAIAFASIAQATVTYSGPTQAYATAFINTTLLEATTTTATSTNSSIPSSRTVRLDGAYKATWYFTHGGVATTSTGGAKFSVEVSPDGSNWYTFNKLVGSDVASTGTSTVTVSGATTTVVASMNITNDTFHFARCISKELSPTLGVDGEQTCSASVEFK